MALTEEFDVAGPVAIIAPPPTPNGDLHVGHLSGPYFGADVLRRYLALRGAKVITAFSVDLNQSYVVTTGERLKTDPNALARKSYDEVQSTLSAAGICADVIGFPDAAYSEFVTNWFRQLYALGVLKKRRRGIPFDLKRGRFLFESYASGWCPNCLAKTNGNICEACGHPNDAQQLLGLYPTGGGASDVLELREIDEFVLELEPMRHQLLDHLHNVIPETRPALARLIAELFAKPLPDFPVTFPSNWGIPAPFPQANGLVLNVWAEMVPGHYFWLDKAARNRGQTSIVGSSPEYTYVQYLGFDNSFFYVVAQLALALAAKNAGAYGLLPQAFVTNEFYLLENFKFSTSQGHLIWGRDLLAKSDPDEVRFYLAWSNPEYNQANFSLDDFETVVAKKLRQPLAEAHALLASIPAIDDVADSLAGRLILERFQSAYNYKRQSLRIAAHTIANSLALAVEMAANGAGPGELRSVLKAVALGMAPLSPLAADRLWAAAGGKGEICWPASLEI